MATLSIGWRFRHYDSWSWNRIIFWCGVEDYQIGGVI